MSAVLPSDRRLVVIGHLLLKRVLLHGAVRPVAAFDLERLLSRDPGFAVSLSGAASELALRVTSITAAIAMFSGTPPMAPRAPAALRRHQRRRAALNKLRGIRSISQRRRSQITAGLP